jgi:hypothetical protein
MILLLIVLLQLVAELGLENKMVDREVVAAELHQGVTLIELVVQVLQIKVMTEGGPLALITKAVEAAELDKPDLTLRQPLVAMEAMELHRQFLDHL